MSRHGGCPSGVWSPSRDAYVCYEHDPAGDDGDGEVILCECGRKAVRIFLPSSLRASHEYCCGRGKCAVDELSDEVSRFMGQRSLSPEDMSALLREAAEAVLVKAVLES